MFSQRAGSTTLRTLSIRSIRTFHFSVPKLVNVGDKIPDVELVEGSPGNKVSIAQELKGKGLVIGVPAAYSRLTPYYGKKQWMLTAYSGPACSAKHIPGYMNSEKLKDAGQVFVVSVNDPFVMKAWGEVLDPEKKSGVCYLLIPIPLASRGLMILDSLPRGSTSSVYKRPGPFIRRYSDLRTAALEAIRFGRRRWQGQRGSCRA